MQKFLCIQKGPLHIASGKSHSERCTTHLFNLPSSFLELCLTTMAPWEVGKACSNYPGILMYLGMVIPPSIGNPYNGYKPPTIGLMTIPIWWRFEYLPFLACSGAISPYPTFCHATFFSGRQVPHIARGVSHLACFVGPAETFWLKPQKPVNVKDVKKQKLKVATPQKTLEN